MSKEFNLRKWMSRRALLLLVVLLPLIHWSNFQGLRWGSELRFQLAGEGIAGLLLFCLLSAFLFKRPAILRKSAKERAFFEGAMFAGGIFLFAWRQNFVGSSLSGLRLIENVSESILVGALYGFFGVLPLSRVKNEGAKDE